jgi:hypothetical protein
MGGHRPADDQPGVGVLDRGEVQPALAGPQVGDVSDPQHVRTRRVEVALDEVGGRGDPGDPDRRLPPLSRPDARDTGGFHQPGDPLLPNPDLMLEPQLRVDPRGPVHAAALVMDLLDLLGQPRVLKRAIGRRATLPVVKPSPAHTQHAAQHGDGIAALLRGDKREPLAYRPSSSLAKKTAAFRRISRSTRSLTFSSRSRCNSSRSS